MYRYKVRMAVLTKSAKNGGYCVAGINMRNGKWERIVTDDEESHGAVFDSDLMSKDGRPVSELDIIDVPIVNFLKDDTQPENILLSKDEPIEIIGKTTLEEVLKIHPVSTRKTILGNHYQFLLPEEINKINHSLDLIEVSNFGVYRTENSSGKLKTKAEFVYNNRKYWNMSITDLCALENYEEYAEIDKAILVMSYGSEYNGRYYKYVAAIYPCKNEN